MADTFLFTNNTRSTLASGITTGATSIFLASGTGVLFPSPGAGQRFTLTLTDAAGNIEIAHCTARSTDTLTVVRAQEGTTAKAFLSGDAAELRLTMETLNEFFTNTLAALKAPLASPALTGNPTATTQAAGNNSTRVATTAFVTAAVPVHRGCLVTKIASQTTTSGNYTNVTYGSEDYDTDSIHDNTTNPSRLTVPAGVTKIKISARLTYGGNNTGVRDAELIKNGAEAFAGGILDTIDAANTTTVDSLYINSAVLTVVAGDYFEIKSLQTSGGNLDVLGNVSWPHYNWFSMEIVE